MAGQSANLLVAQLGGPTAVINSSLYGVLRAGAESDAVDRVLGARNGATGIVEGDVVDLGRVADSTVEGLLETPGAALGSARREVTEADYRRLLETVESYDVGYVLPIGGNGTMAFAREVERRTAAADLEVATVGVPKTVDNDIAATDHCPGYGSAARYYAVSVREVGRDVATLPPPVTVFETMGRDTGWLAAATALADPGPDAPPHLVYLPEHGFDPDRFLDDVKRVYDRLGYALVAVGEGLRDEEGEPVAMATDEARTDATGQPLPGGVAERLADLVGDELGLRARSEKPGLCGRASVAHQSETDREEAIRVGEAAVEYATGGRSGVMAALERTGGEYDCRVEAVPLSAVSGTRGVPERFVAEGQGVTDAFFEYARPLAGGPLPEHAAIDADPVPSEDV